LLEQVHISRFRTNIQFLEKDCADFLTEASREARPHKREPLRAASPRRVGRRRSTAQFRACAPSPPPVGRSSIALDRRKPERLTRSANGMVRPCSSPRLHRHRSAAEMVAWRSRIPARQPAALLDRDGGLCRRRLMPAKYVRPYSKGQKNDYRDAEATPRRATPNHEVRRHQDRRPA